MRKSSNSRTRRGKQTREIGRGRHVSRVTSSCPPTFHVPTATGMGFHVGFSHVVLFSRSTSRSSSPVLSKQPLRSLCLVPIPFVRDISFRARPYCVLSTDIPFFPLCIVSNLPPDATCPTRVQLDSYIRNVFKFFLFSLSLSAR